MASMTRRKWETNGKARYAWCVRWFDETGRHRSRHFAAKDAAQEFLARVDVTKGAPYEPLPDEVTLRYACKKFQSWYHAKLRSGAIGKTTYYKVTALIDNHIIDKLGHHLISDLDLGRLTRWHDGLISGGNISRRTAKCYAGTLKSVLDFSVRRDWTTKNRAVDLMLELRGIPKPSVRTFTIKEVRCILDAAANPANFANSRHAAMANCAVNLAAFCGLRIGEILALDASSLDLEQGVMMIRKNLTRYNELKGPKTRAGVRDLALPAQVREMLAAWVSSHGIRNGRGLVFTTLQGSPVQSTLFGYHCWRPAIKAAGLTPLAGCRFHSLRHFAASWMIRNGWPITEVAAVLGHASPNMTLEVYAHALEDAKTRAPAVQALADQLMLCPDYRQPGGRPAGLLSLQMERV